MIKPVVKQTGQERVKTWIARFVKFNLIGFVVFLIGTTVFTLVFPYFGAWAWLIANGAGAILQFALITYFNNKKRGLMFEQCPTVKD